MNARCAMRQESDELARTVCLREWLKWVEREQMRVINLEPAAGFRV